jgi:hypothetical protein
MYVYTYVCVDYREREREKEREREYLPRRPRRNHAYGHDADRAHHARKQFVAHDERTDACMFASVFAMLWVLLWRNVRVRDKGERKGGRG